MKKKKAPKRDVKAMAKALAGMGTGNDTMLAHITPQEADLLHRVTNGGAINPNTGLPAFDTGDEATGGESWDDAYGGGPGDDNGDDGMESPGMGPGNYGGRGPGPADDGGRSLSDELGPGPYQTAKDSMGFMGSVGRGLANTALGFIGLHNPGPSYHSQGIKSSPGYGFNLGALGGSYLGLATGIPGLGELGARGFNAMNAPGASINTSVAANTANPSGFNLASNGDDPRMARALIGA